MNRTKGQTISESTRTKVLAASQRLNYKPHHAARALRSGRNKLVLLVLPDWPLEHSLRTNLEVLTHELANHGYTLITYTPVPEGRGTPLWAILEPAVVIGYAQLSADEVADMRSIGIRNIIPDQADGDAPSEFTSGPRLQAEYLLRQGHTRLGFAFPPDPRLHELVEARLRLVRKVCREAGGAPPVACQVGYQDGTVGVALEKWRDADVTAVVAYNDETAADVVSGALRSGASVPEDLSVIGHDDSPLAARFYPAISSVAVDMGQLGRYMAALALHHAEGRPRPETPTNAARVIPRESVALQV